MKHKTGELHGALLDAAVAKAAGLRLSMWGDVPVIEGGDGQPGSNVTEWAPSRKLLQAELLIERWRKESDDFRRITALDYEQRMGQAIAAMRAYVASKLGDEVDL